MSLKDKIDVLAANPGIVSIVVAKPNDWSFDGDKQWHSVLCDAIGLRSRVDEPSIRLLVGKHTIVVQREGNETVAVVMPTGHAIAKSLRRMLRRAARSKASTESASKPKVDVGFTRVHDDQ